MDVGQNSSLGHGDLAEESVQLFVVADGELEMSRDDPAPLVVTVVLGGVAGQLEELGGEVLEHRGEVDGGSSSESLGETALAEVSRDTTDRKLQTGPGTPRGVGSLGSLSHLGALSDHVELVLCVELCTCWNL